MQQMTLEDRKKELHSLLKQIEERPSHDWTEQRKRVVVLQEIITGLEKH